jgi:hypothetical protein
MANKIILQFVRDCMLNQTQFKLLLPIGAAFNKWMNNTD